MCACVVYVHVDRTPRLNTFLRVMRMRIRMAIVASLRHDVLMTSHNLA